MILSVCESKIIYFDDIFGNIRKLLTVEPHCLFVLELFHGLMMDYQKCNGYHLKTIQFKTRFNTWHNFIEANMIKSYFTYMSCFINIT